MIYQIDKTVPPNTDMLSAVNEEVIVHPGRLVRVQFMFPGRCAGLARCRVQWGEVNLWPSNPNGYISGDGMNLDFEEDLLLGNNQLRFRLVAWNMDDTYSHTITLRLNVVQKGATLDDIVSALTIPQAVPTDENGYVLQPGDNAGELISEV